MGGPRRSSQGRCLLLSRVRFPSRGRTCRALAWPRQYRGPTRPCGVGRVQRSRCERNPHIGSRRSRLGREILDEMGCQLGGNHLRKGSGARTCKSRPTGKGRAGRSGTAITIAAGANDAKAVAAIEKLIGQTIAVMEPPPGASQPPSRAERPHGHRHAGRKAPFARNDEARPRRTPPSPPSPSRSRQEDSDVSHLPAFLLRPVKI